MLSVRIVTRVILAIIFAAFGNLVARGNIPPNAPILVPEYTIIVATILFGAIGGFLPDLIGIFAKIGIARLAEAITARVIDQLAQVRPTNPFRQRSKKINKQTSKLVNPLIVDTSAIIDGRFAEVCETGFIFGTLVIIPSVLGELQHIADSSDDIKRKRGRRGLEILGGLKKNKLVNVKILKDDPVGSQVDDRLVKFAKAVGGRIVTTDYNLNRVANVSGIKVLNVNELANVIKTPLLPGEQLEVEVVHPGKEKDQGVGYLPDGTMIVVENGAGLVSQKINVEVSRILQTVAGRMIFVRPRGNKSGG